MYRLTINGSVHQVDVEPEMPLLWVLRDVVDIKSPKFGCGVAACGACTVHLDGEAVRSCVVPVSAVGAKRVTTLEGLPENGEALHPVQQAWLDGEVPQCGYCQPGMMMAVTALLAKNPKPSDAEIDDAITNICRCSTYVRIRPAIHVAALLMKSRAAA
jgi:aerobic-type carbon monoxide dehydrogenase small subunit (CoxS/CutS family)